MEHGYKLQFHPHPPPPRSSVHSSYSPRSSSIIRLLLQDYLSKGAILVVDVRPDQYVSRIFEVPKKTGDFRLILDLSDLNKFLKRVHFKMDGLDNIAAMISHNDFFASLDLDHAFFSIAMHRSCWKYLCFDFEGVRYCFVALVFGLSCAPRIFTKMLKVPLSVLRLRGVKCSAWLDDIFFASSSFSSSSRELSSSIAFLESLGFIIKPAKSHLTPSQSISHVGFVWDSVSFSVSVPPSKVEALQSLCSSALSSPITVRFLARIIGTMHSFKFGCPIVPLHYRSLQFDLVRFLSSSSDPDWEATIELFSPAESDLLWWINCDSSLRPSPLSSFTPTHVLETDASLLGWGALLRDGPSTQGRWSVSESLLHINRLELLAVFLAVRSFFSGTDSVSLLICCDNTPTVTYINNMGGTRSRFLCSLSLRIWQYCLDHNIWIRAVYLPGADNTRADTLSREFLDNHDYSLSPAFFSSLHSHFDFSLDIDLFASRLHHHLPRYSSRLPDPSAEFIDAFSHPWLGHLYLFPPVILLSRVIMKFKADNCGFGVLIAPFNPNSPYYSSILDLCIAPPILIPDSAVFRESRHCRFSQLLAWTISNDPSLQRGYRRTLFEDSSRMWKGIPSRNIKVTGPGSPVGVCKGGLILATSL